MPKFNSIRKGCKDIWNAALLAGASFSPRDIPFCPTTAKGVPKEIITYEEALLIHRARFPKQHNYFVDAFVIFSIDDYKFDKGLNGVWEHPERALKILRHFKGTITPDFSTYIDFPEPLKIYNTFRMRAFGYIAGKAGLEVINNVRWDPSNSYSYCFDGIGQGQIVMVATVASQLRQKENRQQFEEGFEVMIKRLNPKTILVYGSDRYECFKKAKEQGIEVIQFPSRTAKYFERRRNNE